LPETLDETYERILRDINKANRDHALRLLHCLTVAIRPLRVEELAEILAIDFDAALQGGIPKSNPNWRWADQHQAVLSTCSSLIAIVDDGDYQVVQFSHFSVKEFLISDRLAHSSGDVSRYHIHLEPAHTILAQACLGVLLNLDGSVGRHNVEDAPLAGYAARYWVDHARFESVSTRIQVAMEYLFDADKPHLETWLSLHDIDHYTWFMANPGIPRAHPLYYAALCGLYDLAKCLTVKHPEHVNSRGGMCATPLVAALIRKHFRIADMLHRHGADVDVRDQWNRTLLHPASANGDVDTVQWLLSHGMDVNSLGQFSWSALHMACHRGNVQVVQALLEHDADINARDNKGAVPLHIATTPTSPLKIDNQTLMLQLLLDHGADVNAQDNEASTPLHYSSLRISQYGGERISGTVEGSRILLEHGANIDAENNVGETPRQRAIAARSTNDRIAEFLAECGAK
jgi:ankyrin repeat protein